ncbi:MAG: GntR family transcriptional regulator [Actinobacteria bacterium]|nr:GntR family transcriptional regulator [Actinomycetota bacterium]MCG2801029.1 GntR family transcriptional regulator [Cellulomonas sp.]
MTPDQVVARLRARLAAGGYVPGERLGDERTLAAELGVPRGALRTALDRLTGLGLVRRTIGRAGGVIASDGRIERHLNTTESLPEIARYQGVQVDTRVLHAVLGLADPAEARRLALAEGAAVHRILRLRLADGRPLSLEASCLPADLFPGLDREDLSSLYRTLRERYGIGPVFSDETLEVVHADREQARHLSVAPGAALLHVQRVAAGSAGRPIELGQEWFVADRMRFHLRKYGYVKPGRVAPPPHPTTPPRTAPLLATPLLTAALLTAAGYTASLGGQS